MIVINVDIMICIMCDVLLLKCAPSVVLMSKYVLCILLESNIPPFFVHFKLEGRKLFFIFIFGSSFFFFFFWKQYLINSVTLHQFICFFKQPYLQVIYSLLLK